MSEYREMPESNLLEEGYAAEYGAYCAHEGCNRYRARGCAYCWACQQDVDMGLDRYWEHE